MSPRVMLHGGQPVADGMTIRAPRLAQGIVVYGTLYEPPPEPAPYYPDWYAVSWVDGLVGVRTTGGRVYAPEDFELIYEGVREVKDA